MAPKPLDPRTERPGAHGFILERFVSTGIHFLDMDLSRGWRHASGDSLSGQLVVEDRAGVVLVGPARRLDRFVRFRNWILEYVSTLDTTAAKYRISPSARMHHRRAFTKTVETQCYNKARMFSWACAYYERCVYCVVVVRCRQCLYLYGLPACTSYPARICYYKIWKIWKLVSARVATISGGSVNTVSFFVLIIVPARTTVQAAGTARLRGGGAPYSSRYRTWHVSGFYI